MSGDSRRQRRRQRELPARLGLAAALTLSVVAGGCRSAAPLEAAPVVPAPQVEQELQPVADGPPWVATQPVAQDDRLNAVLWLQTSAEYRMIARSTYRAASQALELALADPAWSAALEQSGDLSGLPPAVIVDVDETVLDNSPYEASMILRGLSFERQSWLDWVHRAAATSVPGALAFARRAEALGVLVFYVTNRDADEEDATRRNLVAAGFPVHDEVDTVLLRGERPEYVSDKSSRRAEIAARYRILLLVGDDLNDFLPALADPDRRISVATEHAGRFGERWFLLPNADYGSWERALYDNDRALPEDLRRLRKRSQLRPMP